MVLTVFVDFNKVIRVSKIDSALFLPIIMYRLMDIAIAGFVRPSRNFKNILTTHQEEF